MLDSTKWSEEKQTKAIDIGHEEAGNDETKIKETSSNKAASHQEAHVEEAADERPEEAEQVIFQTQTV